MVLDYDRRPDATVDEKLRSLMENIQLALNEKADIVKAEQIDKRLSAVEVNPVISQPIFVVKTVTMESQTLNAGTIGYWNMWSKVHELAPAGFTPVGVVGHSSNHGSGVIFSARLQDNQWSIEVWNRGSAAISLTPVVFILYVRNGLI